MSVADEKQALDATISSLKDELDSLELHEAKEDAIEQQLDHITDTYIQIKQFISRRGRNQWENWGPPKWTDIERNRAALESRLSRLQRAEASRQRRFDRKVSAATVLFMAISAVAAALSAYYAYQSSVVSAAESTTSNDIAANCGSASNERTE